MTLSQIMKMIMILLIILIIMIIMICNDNYKTKHHHNNGSHNKYSETLNNEYIERIHQMSYSLLSDNGMLQIFRFLIIWLYGTL